MGGDNCKTQRKKEFIFYDDNTNTELLTKKYLRERSGAMRQPSILKHIRDIIILPFTVTFIIPWLCYDKNQTLLPDSFVFKVLGLVFLISGLALFGSCVYLFWAFGKGTLAPWTPTQKLIIRGPYKYCRNPMISGVLFIL